MVDGKVNLETGNIELSVVYSGGCEEHKFKLEIAPCRETNPVSCDLYLIDETKGDMCEAFISKQLEFSIEELGLTDRYYQGATLIIHGDYNTKIVLKLPY